MTIRGQQLAEPLLIVGASVRAAAWSAVRAGVGPVAADQFADADLAEICHATRIDDYPAGLVRFLRSAPQCSWMYTGGLENEAELIGRLAALRPLCGNSPAVLREVRDPLCLASALAARRLPQLALWEKAAPPPRDGNWMRKSHRSTGGLGVAVWDGQGRGEDAAQADAFFQQRMRGAPVSGLFVAAGGQCRLLGVTSQLIGLPWAGTKGFRYVGSVGPLRLPTHLVDQFRQIGSAMAERFGLVGLFGVDAILHAAEVWVVEVNPRYTASVEILERALGICAIAMHLAACRTSQLPQAPFRQATVQWGKAVLFARHHVKAPVIAVHTPDRSAAGHPRMADVPWPGTLIRRGAPVATLFACAANRRTVIRRLRDGLTELEQHCKKAAASNRSSDDPTTPRVV